MALILNIETSTDICSVSLSKNGDIVDLRIDNPANQGFEHGQHSRILAVLIKDILNKNSLNASELDALAISGGPGSYTGLRIGVSTAKGICLGANLPLIALNTLLIMAEMAKETKEPDYDLIIPMIDARRMEVYCAVFDRNTAIIKETEAKIINENSFSEYRSKKILFCGNGALKTEEIIKWDNFDFTDSIYPSAEFMAKIANDYFNLQKFVNLVYYEPFYLKSFIATIPKKML
ncbi:MAG: tRNA (adenosine(37)-N6)-threonylcarbamoyltransferase complex dimerization subunit type 1 TsaB [Bacteroidales bacterium]|nr:tRNA (adenosine(37)-N6)-threonylcarbamoyltransferase complex dimerization subunit type 1 TsaB [Bacteroidales bacterium]MDD4215810.1 tRNA (adenosine(37)-N6)-threonylcarbamoyltransferase complex dimerization subunit type 1 TsaB [Bacteroidales bacterium]MDY0142772.1 tRNA (adenosine(37)-N6)-threonylcarbamoyltransferase complex dimerization subunit type 1 TsaB [Bacteroidales bacterium]